MVVLAILLHIELKNEMIMKCFAKLSMILFVAAGMGWSINGEYNKPSLSDLTLNNIDALANSAESGDECKGCVSSLYICRYYGDWGGCLGTAYIFEV